MRSFNTKNNRSESKREDAFHLVSIAIVILLSLIGWGIESVSSRPSELALPQFLTLLESWPVDECDRLTIKVSETETEGVKTKFKKPKPEHQHYYPNKNVNRFKSSTITPSKGSLDLNSMDSSAFEMLPVFGPVLSSRTVKFRNALGGFINVAQLLEVYGIDEEAFEKIELWFNPSLSPVTKLCADSASWSNLQRHPYIGYEGAILIERYRKQHVLSELKDLRLMPQMNDSLWGVWFPYLKICSN